jgi:hypothetical protein
MLSLPFLCTILILLRLSAICIFVYRRANLDHSYAVILC